MWNFAILSRMDGTFYIGEIQYVFQLQVVQWAGGFMQDTRMKRCPSGYLIMRKIRMPHDNSMGR